MWPGAAVERSIFGTSDPVAIWRRVRETWPEVEDCFAFEVSVGALLGVVLADGSRAALKVHRRLSDDQLEIVQDAQRRLHAARFPCPRPLGVRARTTLEEWVDAGEYRDAHEPIIRTAMAELLAELHRLTQTIAPANGVAFVGAERGALWPQPHSVLFDFEATAAGAEWIDEIAAAANAVCVTERGRTVASHSDWSVKHLRFEGSRATVVYDWDSLCRDGEAVVVGHTAATFTYTERLPVDRTPTVGEAKAFVDDYERARGSAFTNAERRAVNAAAVYSRAYGARCAHAVGDLDRRRVAARRVRGSAALGPYARLCARYSSRSERVSTPTGLPSRATTTALVRPVSVAKNSSRVSDASTADSGGCIAAATS
jgi:hypothetical protein